jgi:DNA-binding NarL/FixJ family response regulator
MAKRRGIVASITPRERDVLIALCRPVREMAQVLEVSEAAIKQHLLNLYGKFGIGEGDARRRVTLAREALRSGVISLADLHDGATRAKVGAR